MRFCVPLLGLLGLAIVGSDGAAAEPVRTVCSVTLHSDQEIRSFRRHLPAEQYRFVELIEATALEGAGRDTMDPDDWLGAACESGIRCDILLISGHFAGSFFGSSGKTLSSGELEERACRQDCPGILSHPQEVFLLGCNTAATRAADHRSPEEYLEVLREDGIELASAERIVEARYGALGTSFRSRMQRIFAGVPHLYGFDSVAPSGASLAGPLDAYLEDLTELGEPGGTAERLPSAAPNRRLARRLRHTTFVEFPGMAEGGEASAVRQRICSLHDQERPPTERVEVVEEMVNGDDLLAYLPTIERFFDAHPPWSLPGAEAALARLAGAREARGRVLERLRGLRAPILRTQLARLAARLGWIGRPRYEAIARSAATRLLAPGMGPEERNAVCGLAAELGDLGLRESDFDAAALASSEAARALLCLEPRDPGLRGRMAHALDDSSWRVRARALETFARLGVTPPGRDPLRLLAQDASPEVRAQAARGLGQSAQPEPVLVTGLFRALRDPDGPVRAEAAHSLGRLAPSDPAVAAALARALGDGDWRVQFAAAAALGEILPQDPEVKLALRDALHATSWFVRYKVAETMRKLGTEGPGAERTSSEGRAGEDDGPAEG